MGKARSVKASKVQPSDPTGKGPNKPSIGITTKQFRELIEPHAPHGLPQTIFHCAYERLDSETPLTLLVLAADIRRSTFLMKEAVRFQLFAKTMGGFVAEAADMIRNTKGWFDKFTGDGFLAYWVLEGDTPESQFASENFFALLHSLLLLFQDKYIPMFRENLRNLPAGVGLSLGIDAGPGHLVTVAKELTVVGPTVVGAVRMVSAAAQPSETLLNVYLGSRLYQERAELLAAHQIEIAKEYRKTKEYELQEVYVMRFNKVIGALKTESNPA